MGNATPRNPEEAEQFELIFELFEIKMNETGNLAAAKNFAIRQRYPAELVERAAVAFAEKRKLFENLEPAPIADRGLKWYHGPNAKTSRYWSDYVLRLRSMGWTEAMIEKLDATTSLALDLIGHPGNASFATRGLVVGRVQSGKTAHFTGVVSKAADCNYRLIIVLSGITNGLRLQTQKRLERDLTNPEHAGAWFWLTKREIYGDFETPPGANVDICLKGGAHRAIAVVKKQANVLRRLIDWLGGGNAIVRRDCSVMVIDDEADQASINTGRTMEKEELTRINELVVDLLKVFPRCAYVGYTATPFANVLTHPGYPENLYPRTFIYPLDPPKDYFGSERIHGRMRMSPEEPDEITDGLPFVRVVPDYELSNLKPVGRDLTGFQFKVTPSLERALRYFFLATAARLSREASGSHPMDFSTMLVHTSQRVAVHRATELQVLKAIERLREEVRQKDWAPWKELWEEEMSFVDRKKVDARLGEVAFADLRKHLFPALDRVRVLVSNSMRNEEANVVFEQKGQIMVVIGGNTLSRGLTLEGLVVSFFVRSANAYDTILQMGRWFGYRPYYEDLPRMWMTSEMRSHFYDLATIEHEFREQLDDCRAKALSPLDAAMRIRRLPNIKITAPSKMRFAVTAQLSYGGARPQTIYFSYKDPAWIDNNLRAARTLLTALHSPTLNKGGRLVWRGVDVRRIVAFLQDYKFHPRSRELDNTLLVRYVEKQNSVEALKEWNVVVMGLDSRDPTLGDVQLGDNLTVNCINRSRLSQEDEQTANIKALMSPTDILVDQPGYDASALKGKTTAELFQMRGSDSSGVLILYPISKDSQPRDKASKTRAALGAKEHLIGIALIFPDAQGRFANADYVQADLQPIESTVSAEEDEPETEAGNQ